jgi:hypothetical protein
LDCSDTHPDSEAGETYRWTLRDRPDPEIPIACAYRASTEIGGFLGRVDSLLVGMGVPSLPQHGANPDTPHSLETIAREIEMALLEDGFLIEDRPVAWVFDRDDQ